MRCDWAKGNDYIKYHDEEHGKLIVGDKELFERLTLEIFSTGLSFGIAYGKRFGFKELFFNYDYKLIGKMEYNPEMIQNTNIIRHSKKIISTIKNAITIEQVIKEYGSFYNYLAKNYDINDKDNINNLCKVMKNDGFCWCGKSVVSSFLASLGIKEAHLEGCDLFSTPDGEFIFELLSEVIKIKHAGYRIINIEEVNSMIEKELSSFEQFVLYKIKLNNSKTICELFSLFNIQEIN